MLQVADAERQQSTPGLGVRLIQSATAASLSQIWRIGVTFAAHLVLRRLIPPEQMGVWTWAEPVFILLAQVRDVGVPGHLVRVRERGYGNYLALQAGWGGLLALGIAGGAPLLALGFAGRDPMTVPILRALCIFLFVQGLGSVPLTYFEVEQKIVRTIPAELGRNLCFAVLSLGLAFRGHGVWSIIVAHIVAAALYSAMLWWSCRREIPLRWIQAGTLPLVVASVPLALMSMLELAVLRLDPLILGLRLPAGVVGTAGLAIFAVFFVSRQLADAVGRALYPALATYRDRPARAWELYRVATIFLVSLVVPAAFFFFLNAELVVLFLGGEKWLGATDYLRVAAFVPFTRPLVLFGREFLLTHHRDRLLLAYSLVNLASLAVLGFALIHTPLEELGMAVAGYFPLGALLLALGLHQIRAAAFRGLLANLLECYLWGALAFAPVMLVPSDSLLTRFGASLVAGLLAFTVVFLRFGRAYRNFLAFT